MKGDGNGQENSRENGRKAGGREGEIKQLKRLQKATRSSGRKANLIGREVNVGRYSEGMVK